ncbi:MAG: GNAT family protein [Pseudomonadota bacterium]
MPASIPLTKTPASPAREAAIRAAVRGAAGLGAGSRLAQPDDAAALAAFLSDPAVHAPIYTLPTEIMLETVADFIHAHLREREAGEGLLFVRVSEAGGIVGYSDFQIWPQWAAGELGGALHPSLQSQGRGAAGAAETFDWMFETLQLALICATAALDNIRTARMLDAAGFERRGEVTSRRADGTERPSRVWEITREAWRQAKAKRG